MLCLNFLWLDYYHIVHWCMCSNLPYKNCKKLKEHMWNLNYKLCAIGISILANRKNTLLFWFMYFFSLRSLNLYISNYYILYLKSVHFTSIKRICATRLQEACAQCTRHFYQHYCHIFDYVWKSIAYSSGPTLLSVN